MKNKFKFFNCIPILLAVILASTSCSNITLKKNKVYVSSGTDFMGESQINKNLFNSFDQLPDVEPVAFPETRTIKLPEGKKSFQSTIGGKNGFPHAKYDISSLEFRIDVTEDGMVLGFEKNVKWTETDTWEPVLSDDELIKKAKYHFRSFFGRDIPEGCEVIVSWDYTPQKQKSRAEVFFSKQSEGYTWSSGISIGMTANGELLKMWDHIQLITGKDIPSGFSGEIENQIENWIKDKNTLFTISQKKLRLSGDGTLIAHAYVELEPADGTPFGVGVSIPLE